MGALVRFFLTSLVCGVLAQASGTPIPVSNEAQEDREAPGRFAVVTVITAARGNHGGEHGFVLVSTCFVRSCSGLS